MSSAAATTPAAAQCRYCGSQLQESGARKCTECGEWQHSRDQVLGILLGKASLGDIAIVASILLLLWTTFSNVLLGESAHIEMRTLKCEGGVVTAALFNSGSIDGLVTSPQLYQTGQRQASLLGDLTARNGDGGTLAAIALPPNAGPQVIGFELATSTRVNLSTSTASASQCQVRATKYEKGTPEGRVIKGGSCPCSALSG